MLVLLRSLHWYGPTSVALDSPSVLVNVKLTGRHFSSGAPAQSESATQLLPPWLHTLSAVKMSLARADEPAPLKGHFHPKGKAPSKFTLEVFKKAKARLPLADKKDFEEQKKGLIAPMKDLKIKADSGHVAWDMERFQFLEKQEDFDSIHPSLLRQSPDYGREEQVIQAILARRDSLEAAGQTLAMVINGGDLVKDGRRAEHWERFLQLADPITKKTPYFPIAGNHERTDDTLGLANWHTATGLSISGNLLHYCYDSADGWVRFIALDSNPMVDQYDVTTAWERSGRHAPLLPVVR